MPSRLGELLLGGMHFLGRWRPARLHHAAETVEEVRRIVRAGRCLGVILNGKQRLVGVREALHRFVVEIGSRRGEKLAGLVAAKAATQNDLTTAEKALQQSAMSMGRQLKTEQLKEKLLAAFDDPHWKVIAERCLSCGNCTMVCPTCFCVNIEDATDLTASTATRERRWDSCFTVNFAYIHGGSIRPSAYARYRQWLMHKLVHWQDQFGVLGCVGCGRCITWCPVGIDITEEARELMTET